MKNYMKNSEKKKVQNRFMSKFVKSKSLFENEKMVAVRKDEKTNRCSTRSSSDRVASRDETRRGANV